MRQSFLALVLACVALATGCSRSTPAELLAKAQDAMADGQPRTAQIHLTNLLHKDPDNAAAHSLLGRVSLALGDSVNAERELRRALELGTDAKSVQLPLLKALLAEGKYKAALQQIDAGPELTGKDKRIAVLRVAAAAERGLGKLDAAEAAYRKALQMAPSSPELHTELGSLMLTRRRVADAARQVTAALTSNPQFVPALLLRGQIEYMTARYADAETTYGKALAEAKPGGNAHAQALSQLIETLLAEKKLDAAAARADELLKAEPGSAVARVQKAEVEIAQDKLDSAENRLQAVVAKLPNYGAANRLLGMIYVKRKHLGVAQTYLQAALTDEPKDTRARLELAQVYLQQGDVNRAKALLGESLPGIDDAGLMFALAGSASLRAGDTTLADEYFAHSEQSPPKTVKELLGLSSIYVAAGQFDRAMRVIDNAELPGKDVDSVKTYLLALVQTRQGDFAKAEATAAKLAARERKSGWPLNLQGTISVLQKDYAKARDEYREALKVDPDYVPAMLNLARVDLLLGDRDAADSTLRRVVETNSKQPAAILGLAQLALQRKDFKAAAAWLERAPANAAATLALKGRLAMAQGHFQDAAALFARAFARQPNGAVAIEAYTAARRASLPQPDKQLREWIEQNPRDPRVNFVLASLAMDKGDYDTAISRYESVVSVAPQQAPALNNLAWLYSQRGDDRALATAERAHEAAPDNPAIDDTLGWLKVQNGDAAGGLKLLEEARKEMPKSAEVQYHWAVALAETGDKHKAAATLKELLAGDEQFPGRSDAERRLHALQQDAGAQL